jgi:hypothetical protein
MGNEASQEEEQFYNTEYEEPLESPNVDNFVNAGTTAANCQPKHTKAAAAASIEEQGQEVGLQSSDPNAMRADTSEERAAEARYKRSGSSSSGGSERRRAAAQQDPKKMSYIQMARMGYQELINAIIRPPRADYKVCCLLLLPVACCWFLAKRKAACSLQFSCTTINCCCILTTTISLSTTTTTTGRNIGPSRLFLLWQTLYED